MKKTPDRRTLRGVLLLIPLLAVLGWIVWQANGVRSSENETDAIATSEYGEPENDSELFMFDPNEATYEDFRRLGISARTAAGIVKYRTRGKVFEIAEDFATCYGITDSIYAVLKPYIVIGEEYKVKANSRNRYNYTQRSNTKREIEYRDFDPNALTAEEFAAFGFSLRQAEVIVNFRRQIGGFRTADDFARCYVVSEEAFERLAPYIKIVVEEQKVPNTELNTMDSAELVAIRGIGVRTAQDIMLYRSRLGGFAHVEQLADLKVITERNYELIIQQIWVDTTKIRKISINFATPDELGQHPYLVGKTLRKVLQGRQLKGGWSNTEQMIEDNTLTREQAERLAPYLIFN